MNDPTVLAIPFFLVTMAVEATLRSRQGRGYVLADSLASISGGLGSIFTRAGAGAAVVGLYYWLYQHRIFDPGTGPLAWVALVVVDDFVHYVSHRTAHEVRFFWATHAVHHSSRNYTLATALRQSWWEPLTATLFWLPLPLLGFRPEMIAIVTAWNLIYQYWVHTELIRSLGPLEWVLNTPSHHRVHHGRNPQYLDKNHAGIFIIWDRLFGTFEPEREAPVYGLTHDIDSVNPVTIQGLEFAAMWRDVRRARTAWDALRAVFDSPARLAEHPIALRDAPLAEGPHPAG